MTDSASDTFDPREIDRILDEHGRNGSAAPAVLRAIQERYNYLPQAALRYVCERSEMSAARIAGVSTFYTQFRHRPAGRHRVSVCIGTACHVKGAPRLIEALHRHLRIEEGSDTDPDRLFTVQPVNCLGCCTLAPVVQVDDAIYGYATPGAVGKLLDDFLARRGEADAAGARVPLGTPLGEIRIGLGSCCTASGAAKVEAAFRRRIEAADTPVHIRRVSCKGLCYEEPVIEVAPVGRAPRLYTRVHPESAAAILHENFPAPRLLARIRHGFERRLERLYTDRASGSLRRFSIDTRDPRLASYLDSQRHLATEGSGQIDPLDLDAYRATGGFEGLRQARELDPAALIELIERSGLRGRGGGGFPTGLKWRNVARATGAVKYVICNGDEGDPGAFMDRMLLESYPLRVIEGILIAARAVGATEAIFYIRSEYPLALRRLRDALALCRAKGVPDAAPGETPVAWRVIEGAGAFVCGEETALIASIEGQRGTPRYRPPYPSERGLFGRPTLVNNTETLALVPWILRNGPDAFAAIGTPSSKGTKVFALAGKVRRGGLIEVPMGLTIREVIDEIGGGIEGGRRFKAVQIGGPSGGCIPASMADTPIDYEALSAAGAMMGSGGLVALDDTDCMVEIARFFLAFAQQESCGACTYCRIGTKRLLERLERLCAGKAAANELDAIERLAGEIGRGSRCGLGKTAPNPVLTTLRYFRDEYLAHTRGICPAGQCKALIHYSVTEDCIGCTRCAQTCSVDAIAATPYERHRIDSERCTRCNACLEACPFGAIVVVSGDTIVKRKPREPDGTQKDGAND